MALRAKPTKTLADAPSPMLALSLDKSKHALDWESAFAQPDFAGVRCLVYQSRGVVNVYGNSLPLAALVPCLLKPLGSALAPAQILDGELWCREASARDLSAACRGANTSQPVALTYYVYDSVSAEDFESRYTDAYGVVSRLSDAHICLAPTIKVRSESELGVAQQELLSQGFPGVMLRYGRAGYESGKRSKHWLRGKPWQLASFLVVDAKFVPGVAPKLLFVCETPNRCCFEIAPPAVDGVDYALKWPKYVGKRLRVRFYAYSTGLEPVPLKPAAVSWEPDADK